MTANIVTAIAKGKVALESADVPDPQPGQIQVRVQSTMISPGTERAVILALENTEQAFPRPLGYSGTGVAEKVGPGTGGFEVGQRVAYFALPHCDIGNVGAEFCVPIEPDVPSAHAAMLALGVIALQGVRKARIELGESVMVLGLGPIGQLASQFARINGAVPVLGADKVKDRLAAAIRNGADKTFDISDEHWVDAARGACGGGPHIVIESTGSGAAINTALEVVRQYGRVVLLGSARGSSTVNFYATVHRRTLSVIGAHIIGNPKSESRPGYWSWRDDARAILSLLKHGRMDVDSLVTERVPWQRAPEAYAKLIEWKNDGMLSMIEWQ